MALTLHVDGDRWNTHLQGVREAQPRIVPVIKGNGYGFGVARLAERSTWLGVDAVAVGSYAEVDAVARSFAGSVMVLTPWRPSEHAVYADHVVHTVGRLEDLRALASRDDAPRIVLERETSMRRHGLSASGLREAADLLAGTVLDGVAMHLPISQASHVAQVERLMADVVSAGLPTSRVYLSHLTDDELATLARQFPDYELRPRIGTRLWLGDRDALHVRATVLDVHRVERGDRFGYRSRSASRAGHLLVVSGGTAHGIGLEAPTGAARLQDRAARVARGGLDAAGLVRSPYTVGGKQVLFAEPPHMQASMLFLPARAPVPAVGDEIDVRVRFTTTSFDQTVVS